MELTNIGLVFTRGNDGGLFTTSPNLQSIRFAKGLSWTLRKLVEKRERAKGRGYVEFETGILGKVRFDCVYMGGKRRWVHRIAFSDHADLQREELRHGIQLAIFALSGEYCSLQVAFDMGSAEWRMSGGSKLFDHIGKKYEAIGLQRGLIADLSRIVIRDIETEWAVDHDMLSVQ